MKNVRQEQGDLESVEADQFIFAYGVVNLWCIGDFVIECEGAI